MADLLDRIDERTLYVGTVVVLVVASLVVLGVAGAPQAQGPPPEPPTGTDGYRVTDGGVRYLVHPSELRQGCPTGMDCIPSIDDPAFQPAADATWLAPGDLVVGVELDGEAKAYPLRILNVHEIVNDEVGGRPVAVTYCPLCRSGLVFDRRVSGTTLTFGVSGKLLNANLVMYDRRTETYWSQLNGTAVVGPLVPRELRQVPSTITTWEEWRTAHPDTLVLSRNTGIYPKSTYGSNPYAGYENSPSVGFGVDRVDGRLPPKELVYGVTVGSASRAYPAGVVRGGDVVNDEVGGVPVLLVEDPREGSVKVFVRRVDGETVRFDLSEGALVDGSGNRWSFDGEALEGPHEGRRLDRLNSHGVYWFAWSSFHPDTTIYGGNRSAARGP